MRVASLLFHDVYVGDVDESGFSSDAANRYKLSLLDFEAQLAALAGVCVDAPILATDLTGSRRAFPFLITFDDGGVSYYTMVADRLEALGWRGHCFVSTDFIGRRGFVDASQIRELDARGHVIGSHSASHPTRFSTCSFDRMREEWSRSRQALEDLLGHAVTVASLPGGYYSRTVARAACDAGLRVLFTSEPSTGIQNVAGCTVVGRYTIRRGDDQDFASRLVDSRWTRCGAWASWNAKGLVKPLLGSSYVRIADWLLSRPPVASR
jgi:peptidoglycan/xylan/chitin deacetylase (PgdA/CDA1 family)